MRDALAAIMNVAPDKIRVNLVDVGGGRGTGNIAWTLITAEEAERESKAPQVFESRADAEPGAPRIEVEEPDAKKPIKPPVTIRIKFIAQDDATINPNSFRATYGFFALDITQRIIQNANVTSSGIVATNGDIPPGRYSVTLQIADNKGRVGVRTFDFTVG